MISRLRLILLTVNLGERRCRRYPTRPHEPPRCRTALAYGQTCPSDPWHVPVPLEGSPVASPVRVSVVTDPAGLGVDPDVADAVRRAADQLDDAGYEVEERQLPSPPPPSRHSRSASTSPGGVEGLDSRHSDDRGRKSARPSVGGIPDPRSERAAARRACSETEGAWCDRERDSCTDGFR